MTEYLVYMRHRANATMQVLRIEAGSSYEASIIARERTLGHVVVRICSITPEFDD